MMRRECICISPPTHASWLNQAAVWFSLLARHALRGVSFTRVQQLRQGIAAYNHPAREQADSVRRQFQLWR